MAATKVLEARAVITAQDSTGRTFEQIASKMRTVSQSAKQISNTMRAVNSTTRNMFQGGGDWTRHLANVERNMRRAEAIVHGSRRIERAQALARGAAEVAAAGYGGSRVSRAVIAQAGAQTHERTRMANAGLSQAEITEAEHLSAQMSRTYRSVSQTEVMHMLRNMRSVVGSFEEAAHIAEPLIKLRVIAQAARPHAKPEEINEDFDKLVKGMEIKGVTQHLPEFKRYIEGIAKAINVFGDTLKPSEFYEIFKYGRQSTQNLSEKYMLGVAPTLAQELGGQGKGNASSSFYQAVVGGKMTMNAMKAMQAFDLIDPAKIVKTKTGSLKGVQPGGVVGSRLASENPYEWVQKILLPAMAKKGITDPKDISTQIATMFSNRVAAQLVEILAKQSVRIEKDMGLLAGAKGTEAAETLLSSSLPTAVTGLQNQVDNLAAAAGKPFMQPLIDGVNALAKAAGWAAEKAEKDPGLAVTGTIGATALGTGMAYLGAKGALATFGYATMPTLVGIGASVGGGAVALGLGYGAYNAERNTAIARQRMEGSEAWTPRSQQEVDLLKAELARVRQELMDRRITGAGQPESLLEAQEATLAARVGRGQMAVAGIRRGVVSGRLGFGLSSDGVGSVEALKARTPDIGAALKEALAGVTLTAKLEGKGDVEVRLLPTGEFKRYFEAAASAQSSGNIDTKIGGVGKTGVGASGGQ